MKDILEFLSQPIITSLLTLTMGSYLLTWLTERRSKKDKIREKALQLFEEVGSDFNAILSMSYGHIRNSNFKIHKDSPLDVKRAELFTKRFSVRIKSKAFLGSDEFWQRHEQLTFEIDRLVRLMMSLSDDDDPAEVIKTIREHQERLAKKWPFEERPEHSPYPPPSNELVIWVDMIWDRAVWLLGENLDQVLR
ncbi:MAG: hypothetical protein JOZ96_06915 [Acidobacteria bacterium]|nr:hypothetical protein [Acidobacteriota bacterium]